LTKDKARRPQAGGLSFPVPVGARICTSTGILSRAEQGYEVDQIASDIGMSRQNVEHAMRFDDPTKVGADG
jgi:hypothetical protein